MKENKLLLVITVLAIVIISILTTTMLINAKNLVQSVPVATSHIQISEYTPGSGMAPIKIDSTEIIYTMGVINGMAICLLIFLSGYAIIHFRKYNLSKTTGEQK